MEMESAIRRAWLPAAVAGVSTLLLIATLLILVGRPVGTDDLWFHMKLGETYLANGLWLDAEPMLHTVSEAPRPHAWLFQVIAFELWHLVGPQGLRVVHVLAVVGILGLAYAIFHRVGRSSVTACAALCFLVVAAWYRLFQLRPELLSIPITFLLYRLLLEDSKRPSWREVAASSLLLLVWSNSHALFPLGPLLLFSALLGLALEGAAIRWMSGRASMGKSSELAAARSHNLTRTRRLAAALAVGLLATCINPRGFEQLLAFFQSNSEAAIWRIGDEWRHFDPFAFDYRGDSVSLLAWLSTDILFVTFVVVAMSGFVAIVRGSSLPALRRFDPVLFGLGLASLVAVLGAIRFLWLTLFPLLFLIRALRDWQDRGSELRQLSIWALACLCVTFAIAFSRGAGLERRASALPPTIAGYLATPVDESKYYPESVHFLELSGLHGNLFNIYNMGGYLGFRFAPRLRTFIDGRTLPDLLRDQNAVLGQRGAHSGETHLDILDRRQVDIFLGVGMPTGRNSTERSYSVPILENAGENWLLVSRSIDHAVYLRRGPRNAANLRRIAAYYAGQGIPFDSDHGLDVTAVLQERPDWAVRHHMLPGNHARLEQIRSAEGHELRFAALTHVGVTYALLGAYELQIQTEREAVALAPERKAPRRRLIVAHLRHGEIREALEAAHALAQIDPSDPQSQILLQIARYYAGEIEVEGSPPPSSLLNRWPVLSPEESARYLAHFARRPTARSSRRRMR